MIRTLFAVAACGAALMGGSASAQVVDSRPVDHARPPAPLRAVSQKPAAATPDQARALLIAMLLVGSANAAR